MRARHDARPAAHTTQTPSPTHSRLSASVRAAAAGGAAHGCRAWCASGTAGRCRAAGGARAARGPPPAPPPPAPWRGSSGRIGRGFGRGSGAASWSLVSSLPSHFLGRISPIFPPFFPVFCAFSPSRRGGSNEPQAGTQGQETADKTPRAPFDPGPQRLCDESPGGSASRTGGAAQPCTRACSRSTTGSPTQLHRTIMSSQIVHLE